MNVRIPGPCPSPKNESEPAARGGVDEEELRRIERRAERFLADQAVGADGALARTEEQERWALLRHAEVQEARAIAARAQTLKAEGNARLAIYFAIGTMIALVVGPALIGRTAHAARTAFAPPFPHGGWR